MTAQPVGRHLTALVLLAAAFVAVRPPEPTLGWNALFDVGHFFLFVFAMWLILDLTALAEPNMSRCRRMTVAIATTLLVAALSEVGQMLLPTRVASFSDLLRDAAGAAATIALRWESYWGPSLRTRSVGYRLLAVILLAVVLTPSLLVIGVYYERDRRFPVLATLDGSWWERWVVSTQGAALIPRSHGDGRLQGDGSTLQLEGGSYPGLAIGEPFPVWTGFSRLTFRVESQASRPMTLGVDVHDRWYNGKDSDRFNENFVVEPGAQMIDVPLDRVRVGPVGRLLDLTAVRGIRIYAVGMRQPQTLRLGPLRLE